MIGRHPLTIVAVIAAVLIVRAAIVANSPSTIRDHAQEQAAMANASARLDALSHNPLIISATVRRDTTANTRTLSGSGVASVLVHVVITSHLSMATAFSARNFTLTGKPSGEIILPASWPVGVLGKLGGGTLAPGRSVAGDVRFEVDAHDTNFQMMYLDPGGLGMLLISVQGHV